MRMLLGVVLVLAGCRPIPKTLGEGCDQTCQALIDRSVACGQTGSAVAASDMAKCASVCCDNVKGGCSAAARNGENIAKCADIIGAMNCAYLSEGTTPAQCHDVLF